MEDLKNLHNAETEDSSYKHVLKYTGIFGGVQGLKLVSSLIRNKLTAWLLGSVGMGLISVYNSISEFIVSSSNFGIPLNATRLTGELFEEGSEEKIRHTVGVIRTWAFWTAVFAVVVSLLLSPVLSYFFFEHEWNHVLEVFLVCPMVVALLIAEAECSILKGLRQLQKVAVIETVVAVSTLFTTIPFYYFFGLKGVIVALIVSTVISAVVHLFYSVRLVSYRISPFSKTVFREGLPMIRRGIPYVLAGIANSGVAMAIPALMLMTNTMSDVGYYRAGYALMVAYAGIAFMALEADYFPRLSSLVSDVKRMNQTINQQINVCVLLVTPFLILLIFCMPWVLSILYKPDFVVIQNMAVCSVFYMFFRAIMLPVAYIPLAKGDSLTFLVMEVLYDIQFILLIWWFYGHMGLTGTGIALSIAALIDMLAIVIFYGWKYGSRLSKSTLRVCVFQFLFLAIGVAVCLKVDHWMGYVAGAVVLAFSAGCSWNMLYKTRRLNGASSNVSE